MAGRNLLTVFNVSTIVEAMAEIRRRCNNNNEINTTIIPDFGGSMIGDCIDGLNLSGIAAPVSGTAPGNLTNTGGYRGSELRVWLEGPDGNLAGSTFGTALNTRLGGSYLYTINKRHSRKGESEWDNYSVWLPTEIEVKGYQTYGDELNYVNTNVQFPIYSFSVVYHIKRWNNNRQWWWLHTPYNSNVYSFCAVSYDGNVTGARHNNSSGCGGVSPLSAW